MSNFTSHNFLLSDTAPVMSPTHIHMQDNECIVHIYLIVVMLQTSSCVCLCAQRVCVITHIHSVLLCLISTLLFIYLLPLILPVYFMTATMATGDQTRGVGESAQQTLSR